MSEKRNHKIYNPKMECMSRDERAALQSERLRALVRHEYDHVEVYRKRMDDKGVRPEDIRTIEDIRLLPFMEKTDLRDQLNAIVDQYRGMRYRVAVFHSGKQDLLECTTGLLLNNRG